MKRYLLSFCLLLTAIAVWAVPARQEPFTHQQKDGTTLTLKLVGDEFLHYFVNTATGEAMERGNDGDFYPIAPAELRQRELNGSKMRAELNQERLQRLPMVRAMAQSPDGKRKAIGDFHDMKGTKRGLVILVNFADLSMRDANNRQAFDDQFNKPGYNKNNHVGSVRDYFRDQSYNQFTIDFDVVGPVTVSKNMAYYGDTDPHAAEMVKEAVLLAKNQNLVTDFSPYDWDGDRYVDQVFVIYAGYNEAQQGGEETIWPHEWALSYAGVGTANVGNGYYVNTYGCTSECYSNSQINPNGYMDGIGTACHEFSHCLGYPDIYDTNYATNGRGSAMGAYDVMSSGNYNGPNQHGQVPCGYSAWERWMAGWITPVELTEPVTVNNLQSIENKGSKAFKITNPSAGDEYFMLENRQTDKWFKYVYGAANQCHGLLIYHVRYNQSAFNNNQINIYGDNQRFTFVPADNDYSDTYSYQLAGDFFPGYRSITSFTNTSHASCYGQFMESSTVHKDVTEITETNGLISFKFDGGGPLYDDGTRYTVTFNNNGNITTWTQTDKDEECVLPTVGVDGIWVGMGWSTTDITTITPSSNISWLYEGRSYLPTEDITLYAVYMDDAYMCTSHPVTVNYTVTTVVNGEASTWTQGTERSFTLPAVPAPEGWTFAGWTDSSFSETTNVPFIYEAGRVIRPVCDVTYYAVFKRVEESSATGYHLVSSPTNGKDYLIATSDYRGSTLILDTYYLSNDQEKGTFMGTSGVVYISNGEKMLDPTRESTQVWKCTANGSKWSFSNQGLYLAYGSNGVTLSGSSFPFSWDNNNGLSGSANNATYYLQYSGSNYKWNKSASAYYRVYLYEYAGGSTTYYTTNVPKPEYTVTLQAFGGNCVASMTQTQTLRTLTLPTPTISDPKWSFFGWALSPVAEQTEAEPVVMMEVTPTADITLYAVYFNQKAYISNIDSYVPYGGTEDPVFRIAQTAVVGESFVSPKVRTKSDGKLTFSSSNPEVAEVDAATGAVTPKKAGTAVITVHQAATTQYKEAEASYSIVVK